MADNQLLILNAQEISDCFSMSQCIDAVADAMRAASSKKATTPLRLVDPLIDQSGFIAVMPSSTSDPATYGVKVLSLHPTNPEAGRPAIQGFISLFDHGTGRPIAMIEGASITAMRTAAASAVATDYLAKKAAISHGIFGTGVQAYSHARAILSVRPDIEVIKIWGRNFKKAQIVADDLDEQLEPDVLAVKDPRIAARSDIVSTVTGSNEPVLFHEWLNPGTHVNAVGSHTPGKREVDTETILNAQVYVDLLSSAISEAGDILQPIKEGAVSAEHIIGEIGELAGGGVKGRFSNTDITFFKSLGFAAEDIFAAWAVYESARSQNVGSLVDW